MSDTPEPSPSWSSYYSNSFEYFTGDGNLKKQADGPLIDLIPTALKDLISEEGTDSVSPHTLKVGPYFFPKYLYVQRRKNWWIFTGCLKQWSRYLPGRRLE